MASSATGAAAAADNKQTPSPELSGQLVLDFLKKKGLTNAALDLSNLLKEEQTGSESKEPSARERLEEEEAVSRSQRSLLSKSTGGGYGYDRDAAWPVAQWGVPDVGREPVGGTEAALGVDEARAYLDAFTSVQLWVLGLPDEDGEQYVENPLKKAKELIRKYKEADKKDDDIMEAVIREITPKLKPSTDGVESKDKHYHNMPPSVKPELLAVTFALLVHTYCELLEVGMESTAHTLRDAFKPVYEPLYPSEYRDLYRCTTVEHMVRLNQHNSQHMEAVNALKSILVQQSSYQLRREELNAQTTVAGNALNESQRIAKDKRIAEYDRSIEALNRKYTELSQRATLAFEKMHDLPFLRRARAIRWQITLSPSSYGMLSMFLRSRDDSLLVMSALLQSKCELHVEQRDPLPFTPACVLDEAAFGDDPAINLNDIQVNWAAPLPYHSMKGTEKLPFPKFHLDEEYDDEKQAKRDKEIVEFNRAMLVNGFRRLEAIERKREYETMPSAAKKRLKEGQTRMSSIAANPLEPSILLTTLCASASGPALKPKPVTSSSRVTFTDVSSIWEESGIGLCCAKICPPDGRRIAVGCDDSAVRVFNANNPGIGEPAQVLLGHKNGFPVFDVDWNRDGRSLLSAGGDGAVRLWDTMAVGPFGEAVPSQKRSSLAGAKKADGQFDTSAPPTTLKSEPNMDVPGWRPDTAPYTSGAALAVYRGHAPSSPVWSVAFAPSGYYFASAGGDATARLWTTDRTVPVRLFSGHTSSNVHCVDWHPNCNYIVTGGGDKTVRMWDVQSGRSVRLLSGCSAGINVVKVSPGGRYVAGADFSGIVHLWDLGTGKKISQFQPGAPRHARAGTAPARNAIHSLAFSACGSALATGGDDCCVKIWDVRPESTTDKPLIKRPTKSFPSRQTMIMDLQFTKRNLLLSVGKLVTPVPLIIPDS